MSETKSHEFNAVRSPNVAHWIACSLVAVTGVLLTFGALVTTYEAAMAVPDWPGTYGTTCFFFHFLSGLRAMGSFSQYGHRLLGASVGILAIILAVAVWKTNQSSMVVGWFSQQSFWSYYKVFLGGFVYCLTTKRSPGSCMYRPLFLCCCGYCNTDFTTISADSRWK